MSSSPASTTKTKITPNLGLKEPSMYKVIFVNDNTTTMEFVIEALMTTFGHSYDRALELTNEIHTEGSAPVAVLPYEIAEQKGIEVTQAARNAGYPLAVRLEAE
jgi:ATP-dependent Clp protease adaptor protein ClpS